MHEDRVLAAVLTAIRDHGPASLEALLDRLQPIFRPAEVARSFQGARADRLIEAEPNQSSDSDPVYRLTRAGRAAIEKESVAHGRTAADSELPINAVLAVVNEFTEASLGLVSWELCVSDDDVRPAWEQALADGLLENSAYDAVHDEQMARLTERGRERVATVDEMTGSGR
jgi:hypothetical protein